MNTGIQKCICAKHTANTGENGNPNILNETFTLATNTTDKQLRLFFCFFFYPLFSSFFFFFFFILSLFGRGRLLFHKLGTMGHKQIDTYFWNRGDVYGATATQITHLRYPALSRWDSCIFSIELNTLCSWMKEKRFL